MVSNHKLSVCVHVMGSVCWLLEFSSSSGGVCGVTEQMLMASQQLEKPESSYWFPYIPYFKVIVSLAFPVLLLGGASFSEQVSELMSACPIRASYWKVVIIVCEIVNNVCVGAECACVLWIETSSPSSLHIVVVDCCCLLVIYAMFSGLVVCYVYDLCLH